MSDGDDGSGGLLTPGPLGQAIFGGGATGMGYAQRSAEEQRKYIDMANRAVKEQYELGLGYLEPWRAAGTEQALPALQSAIIGGDYTGFRTSPGYEFQRGEMMRAIESSAAAQGGLLSSSTLKNLQRGAQQLASTDYQNYLANLGTLAGYGYGAAGQSAQMRGALGNVISSNLTGLAPAMAAPYEQQANLQVQRSSALQGAVLQGATMAPLLLAGSDERLKENIKKIGISKSGCEIVQFSYKSNPTKRYQGVIAQQVEKIYPEAVTTNYNGHKMVDYSKLDVEFMEVICH